MKVAIHHKLLRDSTGKPNQNMQDIIDSLYMFNQDIEFYILCERMDEVTNLEKIAHIGKVYTYLNFGMNITREVDIYFTSNLNRSRNKPNARVTINAF